MRLIKSNKNNCVYASVAMLLGVSLDKAYELLHNKDAKIGEKPFTGIYKDFEVVPDMAVICDSLWSKKRIGLTPFYFDPTCSPHPNCQPISTWKNPKASFKLQLGFGSGLLEGKTEKCGHMCAWDGQVIFDPRGHIYSYDLAEIMNFEINRFWLKVEEGSTCQG